ncbi:hypothetical protein FWP33_12980 [Vibrio parahaemolyticus]|nr:hypothetical protein [Vibrio parahaemolyticus]
MKQTESEMLNEFLQEDIDLAKELKLKGEQLTTKMFEPAADMTHLGIELNSLAKKMISFEANIVNFGILNYFYVDIARAMLNLRAYDIAIIYALAGVESNRNHNNPEGILASNRVMLDVACFMGANKSALKLIHEHPDLAYDDLHKLLAKKSTNEVADAKFSTLLKSKSRPKSLAYCLDTHLGSVEISNRISVRNQSNSRATRFN